MTDKRLTLGQAVESEVDGLTERLDALTGQQVHFVLIAAAGTDVSVASAVGDSAEVAGLLASALRHITTHAPSTERGERKQAAN